MGMTHFILIFFESGNVFVFSAKWIKLTGWGEAGEARCKPVPVDRSVRHDVHSHRHSRNRDRMPNLAGQPDEFVRGRNVRHARLWGNSQHTGE